MKQLLLAAILATAPVAAQDFDKIEIKTEALAPGVHVLFGAGGNIGLSTGPDGAFLIDDQYAPMTAKIIRAVKAVNDQPIRFVLNTHWHGDHSGGNENLGSGGVVIVAHDNVRVRMSTPQFMKAFNRTVPASPKAALPVVTFGDAVTLHLNGQTIRAVHVDPAHTDGDTLVKFEEANIVHMGDTYLSGSYPFIDLSSGGSARGIIAAADRGLAIGNATTRYIPGHGAVASAADLRAWRNMMADIVAKVDIAIRAGKSVDEIIAMKPTAAHDATYAKGFITPERLVRSVHESLTAK